MWSCSGGAAQHNGAEDQERSPSASGSILPNKAKGGAGWRLAGGGVDHAGLTPAGAGFTTCPAAVDDGADPGRGRAKDGQAFLGGAQPGLGKVLRRAPAAEPGVVRWIENESPAGCCSSTTWPEKMIS